MHSKFSSDSESNPEEIVANAVNMGLAGICFTDHNDFNYFSPEGESVFNLDQEAYYEYLSKLKRKNIRISSIFLSALNRDSLQVLLILLRISIKKINTTLLSDQLTLLTASIHIILISGQKRAKGTHKKIF